MTKQQFNNEIKTNINTLQSLRMKRTITATATIKSKDKMRLRAREREIKNSNNCSTIPHLYYMNKTISTFLACLLAYIIVDMHWLDLTWLFFFVFIRLLFLLCVRIVYNARSNLVVFRGVLPLCFAFGRSVGTTTTTNNSLRAHGLSRSVSVSEIFVCECHEVNFSTETFLCMEKSWMCLFDSRYLPLVVVCAAFPHCTTTKSERNRNEL